MSIMGSFVGLIVLALAKLLNRFLSQKLVFSMWAIVAFRLLLPVSVSSKFSFVNLFSKEIAKAIPVELEQAYTTVTTHLSCTNAVLLVDKYQPIVYKSSGIEKLFNITSMIWIVGVFICLVIVMLFYTLSIKQLNTAVLVKKYKTNLDDCCRALNLKRIIKIKQSNKLKTPIVMGLLRPTIILPYNITEREINYVLLHECCHIKRYDNWWHIVSIFITCVHWFNPLVWLYAYVSERDIEKACDEKVLSLLNKQQVKEYASVLISLSQKQTTPLLAFGNTAVKERIINIVNCKKISQLMMTITTILLAVLAVFLTTNPTIS